MLLFHLLLFLIPSEILGASILGFFPFPGTSHHHLFGPLMEELAARGHDVVYVTPIKWKFERPGLKYLMVKNYGPQVLGTIDFVKFGEMSIYRHSQKIYNQVQQLLELVLQEKSVQDLIHSNETFDAVILESYFYQEANSALIHKFGGVGIDFVPLSDASWVGELSGLSPISSYMMDFKAILTDRMGLLDKVYNAYVSTSAILTSYFKMWEMQKLMDKYYNYTGWSERPPLTQLLTNRSIILVNKDPLLGYPFPTAPHVKEVGGISVLPNQKLPKDLKSFMDEAEAGVIYMSLGLNIEAAQILQEMFGTFMKVFEQQKARVLIKWESNYKGDLPSNVMVMKKFPQQDILAHKNCVLFVTHGGYMSLAETVYHAVPLVGIPVYGDQPKNVLWAQKTGIGVYLSFKNLSENSISWAIEEVLNNKEYKQKILLRSEMVRDRRHSPLDEAVYWIEHAIKYPNALTPASAYMSLLELHTFDIIIAFLILALSAIILKLYVDRRSTLLKIKTLSKIKLKPH